jgi:hypothetical protein
MGARAKLLAGALAAGASLALVAWVAGGGAGGAPRGTAPIVAQTSAPAASSPRLGRAGAAAGRPQRTARGDGAGAVRGRDHPRACASRPTSTRRWVQLAEEGERRFPAAAGAGARVPDARARAPDIGAAAAEFFQRPRDPPASTSGGSPMRPSRRRSRSERARAVRSGRRAPAPPAGIEEPLDATDRAVELAAGEELVYRQPTRSCASARPRVRRIERRLRLPAAARTPSRTSASRARSVHRRGRAPAVGVQPSGSWEHRASARRGEPLEHVRVVRAAALRHRVHVDEVEAMEKVERSFTGASAAPPVEPERRRADEPERIRAARAARTRISAAGRSGAARTSCPRAARGRAEGASRHHHERRLGEVEHLAHAEQRDVAVRPSARLRRVQGERAVLDERDGAPRRPRVSSTSPGNPK